MRQHLCCSPSLHGVHMQHAQDQVLGRGGHGVPVAATQRDLPLTNSGEDLFGGVLWTSCKWSAPTHKWRRENNNVVLS